MDYVITGPPSCGKTAVLRGIKRLGYTVVPESARAEITHQQRQQFPILPWNCPVAFQYLCLRRHSQNEKRYTGGDGARFLDRHPAIESRPYLKFYGVPVPGELRRIDHTPITKVFLLEQLAAYTQDKQRKESKEEAAVLSGLIRAAYRDAGYAPILVPAFPGRKRESIAQRVEFIMKHTGRGE